MPYTRQSFLSEQTLIWAQFQIQLDPLQFFESAVSIKRIAQVNLPYYFWTTVNSKNTGIVFYKNFILALYNFRIFNILTRQSSGTTKSCKVHSGFCPKMMKSDPLVKNANPSTNKSQI